MRRNWQSTAAGVIAVPRPAPYKSCHSQTEIMKTLDTVATRSAALMMTATAQQGCQRHSSGHVLGFGLPGCQMRGYRFHETPAAHPANLLASRSLSMPSDWLERAAALDAAVAVRLRTTWLPVAERRLALLWSRASKSDA